MSAPHEDSVMVGQMVSCCEKIFSGNPFTMINVGACDGYEAREIARRVPGVTVHLIEGYEPVFKAYLSEIDGNGVKAHLAVIDEFARETVAYTRGATGLFGIVRPGGDVVPVNTISLAEFCDNNNIDTVDFLYTDTEGNDVEVLRGLGERLSRLKLYVGEIEEGRVSDVDNILAPYGLYRSNNLGYSAGSQGNYFWMVK